MNNENKIKMQQTKNDFLSGLTVSLALIPEAIAFAFVAGVEPLVGLYAAFIVGLITSVFGGRPGMISGATGALAVVMVTLVAEHGVQYLFATVILMGIFQIIAGLLKLGRFIRMVPYPVMLGFVNGLAIVIFLSQLSQFGLVGESGWLQGTVLENSIIDIAWLPNDQLFIMFSLIFLTILLIIFIPNITKSVPSSLLSILVVSFFVHGLHIDTKTIGDIAEISGSLPIFNIPSISFDIKTLKIIFPYAIILAAIGLIESLLTLRLIDEITETKGSSNKECIGQGLSNVCTGFFGGMGGCAMIGQSMININSGGRGRLSGITAAISLLVSVLFLSKYIEQIPIASLIGVMCCVVFNTFEWSSFRIINKIPKSDAFVIVLVSIVTVFTDLATAVIIGVIVSCVTFAWGHAKHVKIIRRLDENNHVIYQIEGTLFFASSTEFLNFFFPNKDPKNTILDFKMAKVVDHSGIVAINLLLERYESLNKKISLVNLSPQCKKILNNMKKQI